MSADQSNFRNRFYLIDDDFVNSSQSRHEILTVSNIAYITLIRYQISKAARNFLYRRNYRAYARDESHYQFTEISNSQYL